MPIVEMPNGDRVQFPDDMPATEIKSIIAQKFPEVSGAQSTDGPSRMAAFGRGALQGASFNLADEIAGGAAGKKEAWQQATNQDRLKAMNEAREAGDWDTFRALQKEILQAGRNRQEQVTQEYRAADDEAFEQSPGAYMLGNIGGAVATLPVTGPMSATTKLSQGASLTTKMGAATKDAAALGAIYGGGAGEDLQSRATGAAAGAAVGAVLGPVVPAAGAGAKKLIMPLSDALKARMNPSGFASQKVSQRLTQDGTDLAQIERRLESNPGLSLADMGGENARNLLRTTVNIPGKAQNRVTTRLAMRQMGQGDRLKSAIADTFADPDGYLTAKDRIVEVARREAGPLYEKAYQNPVEFTGALQDVLNTPAGKSALRKAIEIAQNEGVEVGEMLATRGADGKLTFKRIPDMRVWDYIKRGFDDVIDSQTDSVTGKVSTSGRSVIGLKNRLLDSLDEANPDYAAARKIAADGFRLDDALEFGRQSQGMAAEAVRRKFASFSEAEKQAARIGRAEAMRKLVDEGGFTHNKIIKIMKSPEQYRSLRAMFSSSKAFNDFRKALISEARKQKTFNTVRGNSTTAKQLMDLQDATEVNSVSQVAGDVAQGNIGRVVQGLANMAIRLGGLTDDVADEMAKKLMATEPSVVRSVMQEIQGIQAAQISNEQKANAIRSIFLRISSSQTGPLAQIGQ